MVSTHPPTNPSICTAAARAARWCCPLIAAVAIAGCSFSPLGPSSDRSTTAIALAVSQAGTSGIYVSVVDQTGAPLEARRFSPGSFGVFYAGQRVESGSLEISTAGQTGQSVSSALVLDYSGSMAFDRPALETAATAFVDAMALPDRGEIVKFDTDVVVVQPFTSDKSALRHAIPTSPLEFNGATALYDAIGLAVRDTAAETGQRAVVAFTDGHENASRTYRNPLDLAALARASAVPIYTVGLGSVNDVELLDLATATGGRYYRAPSAGTLTSIYQQISRTFAETMQISWPSFVYLPGVTITINVAYTSANGTHLATTSVVLN